jgi:hypothetical protein
MHPDYSILAETAAVAEMFNVVTLAPMSSSPERVRHARQRKSTAS